MSSATRRPALLATLVLFASVAVMSGALAQESPLQAFVGNFAKSGRVAVSGGDGISARGKSKLRFTIGPNGTNARLRIAGDLTLAGGRRSVVNLVAFRPANAAALSNLAPGVDDGTGAEGGTYTATPRTLRASFSFVQGNTRGTASVVIRLKKTPRGTRMLVTQRLDTDALLVPITWTFRAISRQ